MSEERKRSTLTMPPGITARLVLAALGMLIWSGLATGFSIAAYKGFYAPNIGPSAIACLCASLLTALLAFTLGMPFWKNVVMKGAAILLAIRGSVRFYLSATKGRPQEEQITWMLAF